MSRVQAIEPGTDNLASITLYADGAGLNLDGSGVTRVVVVVDDDAGTLIDSSVLSMSWTDSALDSNGLTTYPITFVGADAGLSAGIYRDCRVKIYDASNVDGLVWPERLTLIVEP